MSRSTPTARRSHSRNGRGTIVDIVGGINARADMALTDGVLVSGIACTEISLQSPESVNGFTL